MASINGMQVKDYLQALSDDGKIRVEKIGSGNWYWSFAGEEKKKRQEVLDGLKAERDKVKASVNALEAKVEEAERVSGEGDHGESERAEMTRRKEELQKEVDALRKELLEYSENDPVEIARKRDEVETFKEAAARWTDNIYILEGYLDKLTGGDKEALEQIRSTYYGREYVEGEGLREL